MSWTFFDPSLMEMWSGGAHAQLSAVSTSAIAFFAKGKNKVSM